MKEQIGEKSSHLYQVTQVASTLFTPAEIALPTVDVNPKHSLKTEVRYNLFAIYYRSL